MQNNIVLHHKQEMRPKPEQKYVKEPIHFRLKPATGVPIDDLLHKLIKWAGMCQPILEHG